MLLIADSGSTKTDWILLSDKNIKATFQTEGINPYFKSTEDIIQELYPEFLSYFEPKKIKKAFFYGAGCSSKTKKEIVINALKKIIPNAEISVNHDMLAAARASLGNKPGIACILGTGSNSCLYDGSKITNSLFSLGYMFGDEGSGAHIGKTYIYNHLKKKAPKIIIEKFNNEYNLTDEDILTNIYQKPNPNKFLASFSLFVKKYIDDPFMNNLVENCFEKFVKEQIFKHPDYKKQTVCCVGSIAYHFEKQLLKIFNKHKIIPGEIIKSPMENLIKYHNKKTK